MALSLFFFYLTDKFSGLAKRARACRLADYPRFKKKKRAGTIFNKAYHNVCTQLLKKKDKNTREENYTKQYAVFFGTRKHSILNIPLKD